jgi:hypothetical protein
MGLKQLRNILCVHLKVQRPADGNQFLIGLIHSLSYCKPSEIFNKLRAQLPLPHSIHSGFADFFIRINSLQDVIYLSKFLRSKGSSNCFAHIQGKGSLQLKSLEYCNNILILGLQECDGSVVVRQTQF